MQHYVALHSDAAKILLSYDQAAQRVLPGRSIFFPGKGGKPLSAPMLEYEFHKVWDSISTAKAVPYDFRHNYTIMNINAWIGKGFEFHDRLLYLSKSMGHISLESIKYYYSLVPSMADILDEKSGRALTKLFRRYSYMSKSSQEAMDIAKYVSSFLCDYAPSQLTNSEHTYLARL